LEIGAHFALTAFFIGLGHTLAGPEPIYNSTSWRLFAPPSADGSIRKTLLITTPLWPGATWGAASCWGTIGIGFGLIVKQLVDYEDWAWRTWPAGCLTIFGAPSIYCGGFVVRILRPQRIGTCTAPTWDGNHARAMKPPGPIRWKVDHAQNGETRAASMNFPWVLLTIFCLRPLAEPLIPMLMYTRRQGQACSGDC